MRWVARASAAVGVALVIAAVAANQSWLDRHFLPSFFVPRQWYVRIESSVRIAIAAAGLALVMARANVARLVTRAPAMTLQVLVAAVLAIGAGELAVRRIHVPPAEWLRPDEEPRRKEDAQLGWVLAPARTGYARVAGRSIDYAVDAGGYRVPSVDQPVNPDRPTLVFGGESVMFGEGLTWDESIPAQVAAITGLQSANIAVHGYSTDQIYLRLVRELPRFRQPVAVVSIFMIELFGRNLDEDRPHLAPGLVWRPAERRSRLSTLAGWLVPFRRDTTVDRGIQATREVMRAIVQLARDRGAVPLVVIPRFGAEDRAQRELRARIFTDAVPTLDIPTLIVPLDPDWRLSWDRHPNARAAHVIGKAIAERLHL